MAMGHTEAAWTAAYDKHYQRRECQAGVDAMQVWRQHMLDRSAASTSIVPYVPVVPEQAALSDEETDAE